MNLPVAAIGIAITAIAAPESTDPERRHPDRLGRPGRALGRDHRGRPGPGPVATPGLPSQPPHWRWSGLVALLAFWRVERRVSDPIVDFALFRNGPYFGASAAAFALVGAYWAVMFFQPQYLQDVRGHSPIAAGC